MDSSGPIATQGLRVAIEGCGHGTLDSIYASIAKACQAKGWDGVDLLIIGGDFQAVRNAHDLKAVAMPEKYYDMNDFHKYYSGARTAPYLTIFIGGNHEASSHMWELYYGGWVAPKIYYMGAANVVRLGPLRIAGLSGIWKGYSFREPHYERLPYSQSDLRSIYHVRELDTRKLLQLRTQVDVGLSHDWPRGIEWKGNYRQLFKFKPYFENDAKNGSLGNCAATQILERLRPAYWFSAHMHAKYVATWRHKSEQPTASLPKNEAEIELDLDDDEAPASAPKNKTEIDLDVEMQDYDDAPNAGDVGSKAAADGSGNLPSTDGEPKGVPQNPKDLLPESFLPRVVKSMPSLPFPTEIKNTTTQFLALDKCLPNRDFLQLLEISPHAPSDIQRPLQLTYDKEWLAITRVFAPDLKVGDTQAKVPVDKGDAFYRPLIEKEMEWVEEHLVKPGKMTIPEDFEQTAPVYDPSLGINVSGGPQEYSNPHTQSFCELLQIPNVFHASDDERAERMKRGPTSGSERGGHSRGGYRGGHRGNWGGHRGNRGDGRGGYRGRGRGRGGDW